MNQPLFTGVCTALVTPFLDGKINYPMAEQLLRRQIDAGVSAVVLSGTTGESPTLTDQEKLELFRRCKNYAGTECMIIAGTGSNSTKHAVELSAAAEAAGADALLVVSPYYNKATQSGLVAHYEAIANAVHIPIIIYNVPTRTGVDIPVGVYQQLQHIPNIAGVKEANPDITKVLRIRCSCEESFTIWSGNDDQVVPVMSLGGKGVISVVSNICPTETNAMCRAALSGDYASAAEIQCHLAPLIELLFCEVNPVPAKAILKRLGFDCGACRLPLGELTENNQLRIQQLFS